MLFGYLLNPRDANEYIVANKGKSQESFEIKSNLVARLLS